MFSTIDVVKVDFLVIDLVEVDVVGVRQFFPTLIIATIYQRILGRVIARSTKYKNFFKGSQIRREKT